jgi:hypothetical protein
LSGPLCLTPGRIPGPRLGASTETAVAPAPVDFTSAAVTAALPGRPWSPDAPSDSVDIPGFTAARLYGGSPESLQSVHHSRSRRGEHATGSLSSGDTYMRIRATGAAIVGALALTALVVPAAQADDGPADRRKTTFAAKAPADGVIGDTKITKVTVNGGKDIVLGTTAPKTITVSLTATDAAGIRDAWVELWHGSDWNWPDGLVVPHGEAACTAVNATTSTCKMNIEIDPQRDLDLNALAGTWKVTAYAWGKDGDLVVKDTYKTHRVQRASKLTVNAGPEPVAKGKKLTVTGKLSRANWETHDYRGYTNQPVKLQFRKAGTSTYTTVKTVKTNSTGNLSTTVKSSVDGYWRWSFAGTTTTPAVNATGDYVDVR